LRKNLRESLFGVFQHDEEKWEISERTAARLEKSNQMRVGEGAAFVHWRELCLCPSRNSRDQFERGVEKVCALYSVRNTALWSEALRRRRSGKDSVDGPGLPTSSRPQSLLVLPPHYAKDEQGRLRARGLLIRRRSAPGAVAPRYLAPYSVAHIRFDES